MKITEGQKKQGLVGLKKPANEKRTSPGGEGKGEKMKGWRQNGGCGQVAKAGPRVLSWVVGVVFGR